MRSIWKMDEDYLSNLLVSSLMSVAIVVLLLATAIAASTPLDLPAQEVIDLIGPVMYRSSDAAIDRSKAQPSTDWFHSEQAIAKLQATLSRAEELSRQLETAHAACTQATKATPRFLRTNHWLPISARCAELNRITQETENFLQHLDQAEFK